MRREWGNCMREPLVYRDMCKACTCPELTCNGQIRLFVFDEGILEDLREVGSQIAERLGKIIRIRRQEG